MGIKDKKINWIKRKIKIVGSNPFNFEERWKLTMNNLQIVSVSILLIMIAFFASYFIFVFTPIHKMLPKNTSSDNRGEIEKAALRANELEKKISTQEIYIQNLQNIILGNIPFDSIYSENTPLSLEEEELILQADTTIQYAERELDESLKRNMKQKQAQQKKTFNDLLLFDPIQGYISQSFKIPNHIGLDIVSGKDTKVKACLDGTIIHASYNNQDGYNIIMNHSNNIISVYKHIKTTFVKVGDHVLAGSAIGIIGNTGEQTTGPHLHFELWNELGPINPAEYFSFEE